MFTDEINRERLVFAQTTGHSWEEFAAFSWLFSSWLLDICRHKIDRWPLQPFWEQQMSRGPVKDFRTALSLGSIWSPKVPGIDLETALQGLRMKKILTLLN